MSDLMNPHEAAETIQAALDSAYARGLRDAARAVEAEEEMPGAMPDEMYQTMRGFRTVRGWQRRCGLLYDKRRKTF